MGVGWRGWTTTLAIGLGGAGLAWLSPVQGLSESIWTAQKDTPLLAIWFGADMLIALGLLFLCPPLGVGLIYIGVATLTLARQVFSEQAIDVFAMIQYVTAGGLIMLLVAGLAESQRRLIMRCLVASAVLQVAYTAFQMIGLDPIWARHVGVGPWHQVPGVLVMGTLRNSNYLANYLALAAPLTSGWWTPMVLLLGIYWTGSVLAMTAALLGLAVARGWSTRSWWLPPAGLAWALTLLAHERNFGSWRDRFVVWDLAGHDFSHAWFWGQGLGSWAYRVPAAEYFFRNVRNGFHVQAHNEYIQFVYETGIPGAVILAVLGWWVWRTRIWDVPLAGGAAVTAAILCLASFPLRVPGTAIQIVLIVGALLGWREAHRVEHRAPETAPPAPFPFGGRLHWGRTGEEP